MRKPDMSWLTRKEDHFEEENTKKATDFGFSIAQVFRFFSSNFAWQARQV
jgi:hypothetical protein